MVDLQEIKKIVSRFDAIENVFAKGSRNIIKLYKLNDSITLNIKSFKKPHLINQLIYGYFRKSKARRSFEYATRLIELQIGTPTPIAYFENKNFFGMRESYYVSEHLNTVFEFREIVNNINFPNREEVIRQFTRFSAYMHREGVEFLDHSPGNTLIKDNLNGSYSFYLVDLNRMRFHKEIDFNTRMKNLSRLTPQKEMVAIMSNEYATISGEDEGLLFETLWKYTSDFQERYFRKRRLKKKLFFWRK